jgi:hypothetical protein
MAMMELIRDVESKTRQCCRCRVSVVEEADLEYEMEDMRDFVRKDTYSDSASKTGTFDLEVLEAARKREDASAFDFEWTEDTCDRVAGEACDSVDEAEVPDSTVIKEIKEGCLGHQKKERDFVKGTVVSDSVEKKEEAQTSDSVAKE